MSKWAEEIHESPWRGVFHMTGGGSLLVSDLLTTAGASSTILEILIPYSNKSLSELISKKEEKAVSENVSRQLSVSAFLRAKELSDYSQNKVFGLGLTASLSTKEAKRGQTHAHWCVQTMESTFSFKIALEKLSSRQEQEITLLEAIQKTISYALLKDEWQRSDNAITRQEFHATPAWQKLFLDEICSNPTKEHDGKLVFPGSFNPLHDGHVEMLEHAEKITGLSGGFEITVVNSDKPPLDYLTLSERIGGLSNYPVWVTNAGTFDQKIGLFPMATFVVGVDTIIRIADPKFYGGDPVKLEDALNRIYKSKIKFLVFGRLINDKFMELKDVDIPKTLLNRCDSVPENLFRNDLSSTRIRVSNSLSSSR